jgi:hypothetical protein
VSIYLVKSTVKGMRTAVIYIILFCEVNRATNIYYPLALPEAWTELLQHKADGPMGHPASKSRAAARDRCRRASAL